MNASSPKIVLKIQGIGHVPSFKNHKHSNRQGFVYTKKEVKQWMDHCAALIESGLFFAYQTAATATSTECSLQYWIATSLPLDDSLKWIGSLCVDSQKCTSGEDGFDIIIEPLLAANCQPL